MVTAGSQQDRVGGSYLATEFECDLLEVRVRGCLHNGPSDECGSGECHLFEVRMLRDRGTDSIAIAIDNIDDTWRESSLVDKRADAEG